MEVSTNNQFVKEIDLYLVKTWIVIYRRYRSERLSLIWKSSKKFGFSNITLKPMIWSENW